MAFLKLTQKDTNMSFVINTNNILCVEDSSEGTRIICQAHFVYIVSESYTTVIGQLQAV
jgi:hypothetical protein